MNEALKVQFAFQLHDPYLSVMVCNYLQTLGQNMIFTQFCAEFILMFGLCAKSQKVKPATNCIRTYEVLWNKRSIPR